MTDGPETQISPSRFASSSSRGAGLDDLIIRIRERDADGADAVIVLRRQAGGRDALGQAVALTDLHGSIVRLEEIVDLFLQLDRHAVAAAEHALEAAEVCVFKLVRAQQRLKQRRDAGDDVGLLLDEQLGIGIDVELRDKDAACAANQGGMDADAETEAVEHGHDGEHLHARRWVQSRRRQWSARPSALKFMLDSRMPLVVPVVPPE